MRGQAASSTRATRRPASAAATGPMRAAPRRAPRDRAARRRRPTSSARRRPRTSASATATAIAAATRTSVTAADADIDLIISSRPSRKSRPRSFHRPATLLQDPIGSIGDNERCMRRWRWPLDSRGLFRVPLAVRPFPRVLLRGRDADLPARFPLLRDGRMAVLRPRRRLDAQRDSGRAAGAARRSAAAGRGDPRVAVRSAEPAVVRGDLRAGVVRVRAAAGRRRAG